jgi:hypothetical protein
MTQLLAESLANSRFASESRVPIRSMTWDFVGALGGIRTPNLLIRSQMLYPLSYERRSVLRSDDGQAPRPDARCEFSVTASGT